MFRTIYEIGLVVFLAQGILLVPLIIWAGVAWFGQMARLAAIEKELGEDRKQRERTLAKLLKRLPRLQPLNCAACGGALALAGASSICTNCHAVAALPEDYAATLTLRTRLAGLGRIAIRRWRLARVLVATPVRLFFRLMVIGEPALFALVLIGAATYSDTFLDRAFEAIGEGWSFALMLMSFAGFILWMVVFIFLANLSGELREKLTTFPAFKRSEARGEEFSNCQSCGGGLRFAPRALAVLCGYCGVDNFRPEQTRWERAEAEDRQLRTRSSLFGAMEVIEGFTGTFFVVMTILFVGFALLSLFSAMGGD